MRLQSVQLATCQKPGSITEDPGGSERLCSDLSSAFMEDAFGKGRFFLLLSESWFHQNRKAVVKEHLQRLLFCARFEAKPLEIQN